MFKAALSNLASSVVGAARATLHEYKPTSENVNKAFERIAEQGISNLAFRSPILADMAQTMLQNVKIQEAKKDQFREYIKTKSSNGLRKDVKASLGESASSKKIDAEMVRILAKISNSIDAQGKDEVKKSDIFKQFGKHFTKYEKSVDKPVASKKPASDTDSKSESSGESDDNSGLLTKIENNTQRTFNVLEEIVARGGFGGGSGEGSASKNNAASFTDPMTGKLSVSAAVGTIGGSFLSKVFDDETIEKFANKAKSFINGKSASEDPKTTPNQSKATVEAAVSKTAESAATTKVVPAASKATVEAAVSKTAESAATTPIKSSTRPRKRGGSVEGINNTLAGLSDSLNTDKNDNSVVSVEPKTTALETEEKVVKKRVKRATKKKIAPATENADNIKASVDEPEKKLGLLETAKNIIKDRVTEKFPVLKTLKGRATNLLNKGTDKVLNTGEKLLSSVAPKIASAGGILKSGISSAASRVRGSLLGAAESAGGGLLGAAESAGGSLLGTAAKAGGSLLSSAGGALLSGGALAAAAPWVAGAAAVGAVGYGAYKLYDHFSNKESSPEGLPENQAKLNIQNIPNAGASAIAANVNSTKATATSQISEMSLTKQKELEKSMPQQAPVIINAGGKSGSNSVSSKSQPLITSSPVRNTESTFERVQMKDFWPRMA